MNIRLLSKFHSLAKISLFGTFFTKFFDHMFTYALKIWQKICSKILNFFKQSEFRKKSIALVGMGFVGSRAHFYLQKSHNVLPILRGQKIDRDFDVIILCMAPKSTDDYESCYLETAKNLKKSSAHIIYTSSTSVYGPQEGKVVNEETPCKPKNRVQEILLETEKILLQHPHVTIFRLGEIYGYTREFPLRFERTFPGTGENFCNIIHVDDVIALIDFTIQNRLFGIFNACSEEHLPRREFYQKIANHYKIAPPKFDSKTITQHADNKMVANNRIKKTGFIFKHPTYKPPLEIAFSPCPNDTFLFHAWVTGLVGHDIPVIPVLKDVQTLNSEAKEGRYPITKLSFYALNLLQNEYVMLPIGAALGFGCGPKLVSKKRYTLDDLPSLRLAIPGKETTAHLLALSFLPKPKEKLFCTYDQIFTLLENDLADCGIIIHEQRFSFEESGFKEIVDLGALWEEKTNLPLPLGCIAAKRSLGTEMIHAIIRALKDSLAIAQNNPHLSEPYILANAQVKDPSIIKKHIDLYITRETLELSDRGLQAINCLTKQLHSLNT